MKRIDSRPIRRILIRAANWVGDAVMSTPMIRAVRHNFPEAEIYILAKPWVAPLFENSPDIDRILIYENEGRHKGPAGVIRLGKEMRRHRFDLAVSIQNAFEAALIFFLAGIPNRLGYDTDGRPLLLTHPVPMTPEIKQRHMIDYYLGILEGVYLKSFGNKMSLHISKEERGRAGELLKRLGLTESGGLIGVNPGAAFGTAKRWPADRYAEVCRHLRKQFPHAPVAVFGSPGEKRLGASVCRMVGEKCVNLCGETTLREAVALIERCSLFLTNDSGLMHVAAALEIPQIAVFGSTDHTTTYPADRFARIVRVPTPCSPCMKPDCPLGHHQCMRSVSVKMVYEAALALLGESAQ